MSASFEAPSHDALIAEQETVQAEKFQGRLLAEYSSYMFPGQNWREPRGSAVADFVRPFVGDTERVSLNGVLKGLIEAKAGELVNWVDMGGGRALPMRQLASTADFSQRLKMTNVDLFNFEFDGVKPEELEYLEGLAPGMTTPDAEPTLINDNIETVQLPEPAELITSIEAIQYLNNPLQAVVNWYNQLSDNGLLFVAAEHDWASWIRYSRDTGSNSRDETPVGSFLKELSRAGINYAATSESDWASGIRPDLDPERIRILAIQKKPKSLLKVSKPVTDVWVSPYNFKAAYYEAPTDEASHIIEAVRTDAPTILGATTLKSVA